MNKPIKFIRKWYKKAYLISLFLVGLPPFFIGFSYLNTNSLAKLIWLILFLTLLLFVKPTAMGKSKTILWLFLALFLTQSLSILPAKNLAAFLNQYEDLVFTAIFVVTTFYVLEDSDDFRNVILILFLNGLLNFGFQAVILFFPNLFLKLGEVLLHKNYLELIKLNIARSRLYFEVYDETLIPIVYYFIFRDPKRKITYILYLLSLTFFAFASNFRTRFLMLIFALGSSFIAFFKNLKRTSVFLLSSLILFTIVVYSLFVRGFGFTVIERLLLEDRSEDVLTVTKRFQNWERASEIGISSPLLGVGLGNYFDYLEPSKKYIYSALEQKLKEFQFAAYDPHNIFFKSFAETGVTGVALLIGVFVYFVKKDTKILSKKHTFSSILVISFWTLVIHALFNPSFTIKFQIYFWLFRILIERSNKKRSLINFSNNKLLKFKILG